MEKNNDKEVRYIDNIQSDINSRTIEGYAIVFDSYSNDMGFVERIEPTAIDEDTLKKSDVFCWLNHNHDRGCLARCKNGEGSLSLSIDERGLKYSFEAPNTQLGNEVLESIKRGDITSSSFAFSIAKGGDKWEKKEGKYYRTITKINKLHDVSPVYQPAYDAATCTCRSFEEEKKREKEELDKYWDEMLSELPF